MSFKEEKNAVSHWSRYSPSSETTSILTNGDDNLKELFQKAYKEKQITTKIKTIGALIVFSFIYTTWNFWRWFTPGFYQKIFAAFVQSQTDEEETELKGWVSYLVRNTPKRIQQYKRELYTQIIDDWTVETTLRIILLPLALILGCFQSSSIRYSFLFPKKMSSYPSVSWQDFQKKQKFVHFDEKHFEVYDKYLLAKIPQEGKTYRILLPPVTPTKDIISAMRKNIQPTTLNGSPTTKKLIGSYREEFRKNYFRQFKTRVYSTKGNFSALTFHNDPKNFFPGVLSNITCLTRIYAAVFPLWCLLQVWDQINLRKADARTTKAKKVGRLQNRKRFKDLAGIEKLLPDLHELVKSLQQNIGQTKLARYAPKGYILVGPPGTGKTLLAQAIAGESKVPFFFTAGSEFIESQNGIGPARLRDLFKKAKKEAPAILFIDEIDTLGKTREGSVNSLGEMKNANQGEEKIQILTEFLVQMDGFSERSQFIIIGATNFLHLLDPAFIRPGRFDRIFQLELPSKAVRIDILKLHASRKRNSSNQKIGVSPTIPWDTFGKLTNGFSGADLSAIVNESLLKLIRENRPEHTLESLQYGFNRISTYSRDQAQETKQDIFGKTRKAYYQAGMGLIYTLLPQLESKLTLEIDSRPKNIRYLNLEKQMKTTAHEISNKNILEAKLMGYLSGFAAEYFLLKELSSLQEKSETFWVSQQGASDLEKATKLLSIMIDEYGMYQEPTLISSFPQTLMNSTPKRFNEMEIYSYNQIWASSSEKFFNGMNEEEDKEKPIRMNWRFLRFWVWQLTGELYSSQASLKWGKAYIDEKPQENQDSLVPDNYFHKNQLLQPRNEEQTKRDLLIQEILKKTWKNAIELIESNRELLDLLAYSLLLKNKLIENEIIEIVSKYQKIPQKIH